MNKLLKSALSLSMALALMFSLGTAAFADDWYIDQGNISISATESGQTVTQGEVSKNDSTPTITAHEGAEGSSATNTTTNTVTINAEAGATANVTLSDVHIDTSSVTDGSAAISITGTGNVNIELDGNNTVQSADRHAGVEKSGSGRLTIKDETKAENGIDASITATGGNAGAGIGGAAESSGENIEIKSGNITATGGAQAAGIGGGSKGSGENIKISGGTITAKGGEVIYGGDAAGIGGGSSSSGKNITISNATVIATGSSCGAGIGGGSKGSGENITIENSTVTATGGNYGAGIGGGFNGSGEKITIEKSDVTAYGGKGAAGIGGGLYGDGTGIHITGGKVTATGGRDCYNDDYVEISGGAGIGGGAAFADYDSVDGFGNVNCGHAKDITISDAEVKATGGNGAAGIGGGATAIQYGENNYSFAGNCTTIKISGNAKVTAQGGQAYDDNGIELKSGTAIGNGSTSTAAGTSATLDTKELTGWVELKNADGTLNKTIGDKPETPAGDSSSTGDSSATDSSSATSATLTSVDTTSPDASPLPVRYYVVTGAEQTWLADSEDGLEFTLNSDSVNVLKVLIDGEEVEFEINDNGDIVISAEVLQALEAGAHEIEFVFPDGSCKTDFTVK